MVEGHVRTYIVQHGLDPMSGYLKQDGGRCITVPPGRISRLCTVVPEYSPGWCPSAQQCAPVYWPDCASHAARIIDHWEDAAAEARQAQARALARGREVENRLADMRFYVGCFRRDGWEVMLWRRNGVLVRTEPKQPGTMAPMRTPGT